MNQATTADEITALLPSRHEAALPDVSSAINRIFNPSTNRIDLDQLQVQSFATHSIRTAFLLVVLLQVRHTKSQASPPGDPYEAWSRTKLMEEEVKLLEDTIISVLSTFLEEYRSPRDIEAALWTRFPEQEGSPSDLRIVDFLVRARAPGFLVSHPLIMSSLERTWYHGFSLPMSAYGHAPQYHDPLCTPQISHLIELTSHIVFLFLLVQYLLHPPERPHTWGEILESLGIRELLLIVLASSFLIRPRPGKSLVPVMVLLAFALNLPSFPFPGDISFGILLWACVIHTFKLYSPLSPSLLFLFYYQRSLPLVNFLYGGFAEALYPTLIFFPLFIFALFLLSVSMAENFLAFPVDIAFRPLGMLSPVPIETRTVFLLFLVLVLTLASSSVFFLGIAYSQNLHWPKTWDHYSRHHGLAARRSFIRVVRAYSGSRIFPPPLNILYMLCVQIPQRTFGANSFWTFLDITLWRIGVFPFVLFFSVALAICNPAKFLRRVWPNTSITTAA